ncbi:hypothetical protein NADFUDRAFT_82005 [Nadsonia fulvescens var. elongata DSM 6958]|uniref:Uncharacterized protein n=1 Tax=Nadsonia fulvescens var. elongata DSM 6958 TaxID=857566 RepID=A0A1E3PQI6_9ASCO|nr:hypothetical protein NADFUDRAFT_82005 [Nadsonia fulvescens var. elongata DSM 6958]
MTPNTKTEPNDSDTSSVTSILLGNSSSEDVFVKPPSTPRQNSELPIPDLSNSVIPHLAAEQPKTPGSVEFNIFEFPSSAITRDYINLDSETNRKSQVGSSSYKKQGIPLQTSIASPSGSQTNTTKRPNTRHERMRSSISSISSLHGSKSFGSESEFEFLVDSSNYMQPLVTTPLPTPEPWPLHEISTAPIRRPLPRNTLSSRNSYNTGHFSRRSTCYALSEEEQILQERLQELARNENAKLINASMTSDPTNINEDSAFKSNPTSSNITMDNYSRPSSPYVNRPLSPISSPVVPFPIFPGFHMHTPGSATENCELHSPQFGESPGVRPSRRRQRSAAYSIDNVHRKHSPANDYNTSYKKGTSRTIFGSHSPKKKQLRTFSAESDLGLISPSFHDNNSVEKISQMDYEEPNSSKENSNITGLGLYLDENARMDFKNIKNSRRNASKNKSNASSCGSSSSSDSGNEFLRRVRKKKSMEQFPDPSSTPPIPNFQGNIYSWKMSGDILESFLCFSESRLSILDLLKTNWQILSDPNNLKIANISKIRILPPYNMLITIKNSIPKFLRGIVKSCKNTVLGTPKFMLKLCIASITSSILVVQVSTILSFVGLISSVQFVFSSLESLFSRFKPSTYSQTSDQVEELLDTENEGVDEENEDDGDGEVNNSLAYGSKVAQSSNVKKEKNTNFEIGGIEDTW